MANEILTPGEMAEVDRKAIAGGPSSGISLMRNAGRAVVRTVLDRYPQAARVDVLCGPGNNGGDGYVVARLLREAGVTVALWAGDPPRTGSDAALAAAECPVLPRPLRAFAPKQGSIVVDALFGAGLSKPIGGADARAIALCGEAGTPVVAVDLPSGVSGETGEVLGAAFEAEVTVTFVRKKPGHLLQPGRRLCGEVIVADIGIADDVAAEAGSRCFENSIGLWIREFPSLDIDTHKYRRGHVGVFSGGPSATGAARLAAMAAARAGAGAVTVLSPDNSLAANAAHLTSIMLRKADSLAEADEFLKGRRPDALILGPGLNPDAKTCAFGIDLLAGASEFPCTFVFDASALTSFARQPEAFFAAARGPSAPPVVLTPHQGEFTRLFPAIAGDATLSKLEKARAAARHAASTVLFKGPDTVIASPDGRAAINANGTPLLATAGSGDVLSGIVAALAAQGMQAFEAASAAVWMHAEAARRFGPGLIAEDLPLALLPVLRELAAARAMSAGRA